MHGFTQSARRAPHTQPLGGLTNSLDQSLSPKPIASPYVLTTRQAQALRNVELALAQLEANLDTAAVTQPFEPSPQPELRLRATL